MEETNVAAVKKTRGPLSEEHRKKIAEALKGNKNRMGGNKDLEKK